MNWIGLVLCYAIVSGLSVGCLNLVLLDLCVFGFLLLVGFLWITCGICEVYFYFILDFEGLAY